MTTYTLNPEFKGIEVKFSSIPSSAIRENLKANGFRWHKQKAVWYAKETAERLQLVKALAEGKEEPKEEKEEVKPLHSFKVGDLLFSSWGYEQTNVDFYQVVALKGRTMVTVKKCYPERNTFKAVSSMSEDVSYIVPDHIIADEEEEPITRKVKNFTQGNLPSGDLIDITSYATASKYTGQVVYQSWYY